MKIKCLSEINVLNERLQALKQAPDCQALVADDRFMRRLASLEVRLMALTVTARRDETGMREILRIKIPELDRDLSALALEVLGYYGLPYEPGGQGSNEPPVGSEYARRVRARAHSTPETDAGDEVRDLLARRLFEGK